MRTRLAALLLIAASGAAAADVDKKLAALESEARAIAQNLPKLDGLSGGAPERRLVDAQIAFSLGDYDRAALMLFELANQPGAQREDALYYLAESLFLKGDKGASRAYYTQVIALNGKHHAASLRRMIEIAIAQNDATDVETHLAALTRLSRSPEAVYVEAKWAFSQGKYDDAITLFNQVPNESPWELQAKYYIGTANVAKKDLARAQQIFTELTQRKPKSPNDRRVLELSQLALGRVYYERDQLGKSIDSYLLLDRKSDLFTDALYEVAWVYVKTKQYDKALRALELLSLSAPTSNRTPTLRILEGNLRIRKAQMNRQAQIANTIDASTTDPGIEYEKAAAVFRETHDAYFPSYQALEAMVAAGGDAAEYLAQLAERNTQAFQAAAPLPEAAAQYLREEPEVQRVVTNQADLQTIESDLAAAEATMARLEAIVATNDRDVAFPAIASRRGRLGQIQAELIAIRNDVNDQQASLIAASGNAAGATAARKQLAQQWAAMPNAEQAHGERTENDRAQYDKLSETTFEISAAIDTSQAIGVSLRKYISDRTPDGAALVSEDQRKAMQTEMVATAAEVAAIEAELRELRTELTLGRDLAGIGDAALASARETRRQLEAAQDTEHRALAGFASASRDAGRSKRLVAIGDRAARISSEIDQTEKQLDALADRALAEAKTAIQLERKNVDAYKSELAQHELESRSIGSTVLGASFKSVKARFYDIVIRTDVGVVDVAWSEKEDADDDFKRLNLSRSRELKLITDEFKDILETTAPTPTGQNLPAASKPFTPGPGTTAPAGSPDAGAGTDRVKPIEGDPKQPAAPTVRPDNETKPAGGPKQ